MPPVYLPGTEGGYTDRSPAQNVALVVPNDTTALPGGPTRGISFVSAGDLKVLTSGGQTVIIPNGSLLAGIIHPISVVQIFSIGTGASGIVAYW